jgi:hypothetical protein
MFKQKPSSIIPSGSLLYAVSLKQPPGMNLSYSDTRPPRESVAHMRVRVAAGVVVEVPCLPGYVASFISLGSLSEATVSMAGRKGQGTTREPIPVKKIG